MGEGTRRDFLKAVAVAATASTVGAVPGGPGKRVAVLGGGVAGLSAAHELIGRGFAVDVYERKALGGKARSFQTPGGLPAEHGFRIFPGFYFDLTDTMRRIPFPGNAQGCWGNLTRATSLLLSRRDRPDLTVPFPFPLPPNPRIYSLRSLIATIVSGIQTRHRLPLSEAAFFAQKIAVYVTSSDERRLGQWDRITWADFIRVDRFSEEYNKLFGDGVVRNLAATKARDASTHSACLAGEASMWSILGFGNEPGGSVDRLLDGATSERWIDPWVAHLRGLGVRFHLGWEVDGLVLRDGRIAAATAGRGRTISADWFVLSVPSERAAKLITPALAEADPSLAGIARLRQEWMNGLMFYLRREAPLSPGHVNYVDSAWAVTSISQAQFWDRDLGTYGDGSVKDCLSAIISDWVAPGTFNGRRARDCTPAEVAEETWKQIKAHIPEVTDDLLHSWFLDPAIANGTNDEPLLIQSPGSWADRPGSRTAVENLFLAGDWVRCPINFTTMEGANQAARQAVNALLDAAGSGEPRCRVHELYRPPMFEDDKAEDRERYLRGLPNKWDILDPRQP